MPVEIKEIVIKAVVENKLDSPVSGKQESIELHQLNMELMMAELLKKVTTKNER